MQKKENIQTAFGDLKLELHVSPRAMIATRHSWDTNRHTNIDYELHIVVGGSCSVDVEGAVYELHAGQGILILPDKFHKPIAYSQDFDRLILGFFPLRGNLLIERDAPAVVLDFSESTTALARDLMDEYANPGQFYQKMLRSLLDQLTIRVLRKLGVAESKTVPVVGTDLRVDVIDGFFTDFLAEDVTKEDLAARLHLSTRQVNRFLQKRYGMSFREKLFRSRMLHAGWLLQHTEQSVRQVAQQVGYSSVPAFIRSFARFHGKTPQQFREQAE